MVLTILEFVLALGALIFIHELGHFLLARLFKIEVEEFGFGFPPRIVRLFTLGGTEFTLNWIPFGAFVRPKGENDPDVPGGLAAANPWKRLAVLLAGPVFNLVTGALLFALLFGILGRAPVHNMVQIYEVVEQSPAERAGLAVNDIIRTVNGSAITDSDQLRAIIRQNYDREIAITVEREGEVLDLRATPRQPADVNQGALGIRMGEPPMRVVGSGDTLLAGVNEVAYQIKQLISLPGKLMSGTVTAEESRAVGPVGMYSIYSQLREMDQQTAEESPTPISVAETWLNRLNLFAAISVALGITNLLPLPALDGGRILFLLPEILFRRRVPARFENVVHLIGFAALLILMVYITAQDVINPIILPK